ncbi:MAG: phenylalanine--tRNA ligase alpha subunit [Candidatus Pelagibacterales bacterium]|jgi:phenylalanyl-tRNA synthetase alpha chain|nr:MAG: phenylalanine--tRNA ligase alpha subunit [Pelagibacterales bacterium]
MKDFRELETEIKKASDKFTNIESINEFRIKFLGKKGIISLEMKELASLSGDERKQHAEKLNKIKDSVLEIIASKTEELNSKELEKKLNSETLDITLSTSKSYGTIHPISQVIEEVITIFGDLDFFVAEGPEVETDYNNFTALNTSEHHPARQMHDTFYVETETDGMPNVLRTHTSPVQIRSMLKQKPPIRLIAPGKTFRCDNDQTHSPMFHQVEGLVIDQESNMSHLKGCLEIFLKTFFETDKLNMRFRPSHFPFTEPSAEVDIGYTKKGNQLIIGEGEDWLEILGCGMVHPNVLENVNINSNEYQGYAFGMGIERLAMLKYGISDLRTFFDSDLRWNKHYGFSPLNIPSIIGDLS